MAQRHYGFVRLPAIPLLPCVLAARALFLLQIHRAAAQRQEEHAASVASRRRVIAPLDDTALCRPPSPAPSICSLSGQPPAEQRTLSSDPQHRPPHATVKRGLKRCTEHIVKATTINRRTNDDDRRRPSTAL